MGVYIGKHGEVSISLPDDEFKTFKSILDMPPKASDRLKELLKNPSPWPETDWGNPVGEEVW